MKKLFLVLCFLVVIGCEQESDYEPCPEGEIEIWKYCLRVYNEILTAERTCDDHFGWSELEESKDILLDPTYTTSKIHSMISECSRYVGDIDPGFCMDSQRLNLCKLRYKKWIEEDECSGGLQPIDCTVPEGHGELP